MNFISNGHLCKALHMLVSLTVSIMSQTNKLTCSINIAYYKNKCNNNSNLAIYTYTIPFQIRFPIYKKYKGKIGSIYRFSAPKILHKNNNKITFCAIK